MLLAARNIIFSGPRNNYSSITKKKILKQRYIAVIHLFSLHSRSAFSFQTTHFFCSVQFYVVNIRGRVEDTRLEAKDTKKSEAKDTPSENRHSLGQGQECSRPRPRTKDTAASVLKKKKSSKKFFRQSPIYRRSQNF